MTIKDNLTGIQHVGIPTNDIEETVAFYEKLGFVRLGTVPQGFLLDDGTYEDIELFYHAL